MKERKMDAAYFSRRLRRIPHKRWLRGASTDKKGAHDVWGHLGVREDKAFTHYAYTISAVDALRRIENKVLTGLGPLVEANDYKSVINPQGRIKQRVLGWLKQAQIMGH